MESYATMATATSGYLASPLQEFTFYSLIFNNHPDRHFHLMRGQINRQTDEQKMLRRTHLALLHVYYIICPELLGQP